MALLEVKELRANYKGITVLHGISLSVGEGETIGVIGSNGAGKSTLLRSISGLIPPSTTGEVLFDTDRISGLSPARIVRLGVAHCPEGRMLFPRMQVIENLKMGAYLSKGDINAELDYVFSLFPTLSERKSQYAGTLSGGERQMLAIGRALMSRPRLLMLDEPTLGLAPLVCQELADRMKIIQSTGISILLVEQSVELAFELSQRCYVMEQGRVVMMGKPEELRDNPRVREAYLGL